MRALRLVRRSWPLSLSFVAAMVALAAAVGIWSTADSDAAKVAPSAKKRALAARSFAFAIGDGASSRDLSRYGLIVVDGEGTSAARVKQLRKRGAVVLAYLSVGTIEKDRSWYSAAGPYKMELWGDWGEWYADTSQQGFRRLISRQVAPKILAKGFDGLFLDNVDMVEGHPAQRAGMVTLVKTLAGQVHAKRRLLFTQNGEDSIGPILSSIDGWNREDVTGTYDFDSSSYRQVSAGDTASAKAALTRMKRAGKVVTMTDYAPAGDSGAIARSRAAACSVGAIPFVSDIALQRMPSTPVRC